MHVLTLTPFYPSAGDEVSGCFVAESLRHLQSHGITSSVIAVDSIYHAARKSSLQNPAVWIRHPQLPGNFGLASAGHGLAAVLSGKVTQLHQRLPVNLIHAHAALPCGHAALLLSRRLRIPYVVTIHGLDAFNHCFQNGIAAKWRHKIARDVYQGAAKVICISARVQQILQADAALQANSTVVYNGTDAEFFSPATAAAGLSEPPTLLMVGNLLAGKGHELVLRSLAVLQGSHPDLQCKIIGEGADRDRFVALAHELGIYDRTHFLGRLGRAEVAAAMRACRIFVLPSRYEGLGCVYLEAMACGKPTIACRGQGIEEIIQHGCNGWLIAIDGLDELVQGLRLLLENEALRARIGNAARHTILSQYTFEHQSCELMRIYREVSQ